MRKLDSQFGYSHKAKRNFFPLYILSCIGFAGYLVHETLCHIFIPVCDCFRQQTLPQERQHFINKHTVLFPDSEIIITS